MLVSIGFLSAIIVVLRFVVISLVLKAEEFEHETITGKIKISHTVGLLLFVLLTCICRNHR